MNLQEALKTDYPLIPMENIDDEARILAIRWHENATDWIGDKHKLASDIMNYARRHEMQQNTQSAKVAIEKVFEKDPIKLLQFMLLCAGRDMKKSNAAEMKFSCEMDVEHFGRYNIEAVITLNPVADSSTDAP